MWAPLVRPLNEAGQAVKEVALSSWHSKVTGDLSELKAKTAVVALVTAAGPETMVVSGAVVPIDQE